VNPAAGRGRAARLLPQIRAILAGAGVHDIRLTTAPGDERRLARDAAAEGIDTIIALGGDGTWGNAARGMLESGRDARLALLAAGTGNDFAYTLGLPVDNLAAMVGAAVADQERRLDMGQVNDLPFLNVAGVGIEAAVLEASQRVRLLRGPLVYVATAIPKLHTFRAMSASVTVDGATEVPNDPAPTPWLAIVASNGPRFGGGFRIAPGASPFDGQLDLVTVRDAGRLRRATLFVRARRGTHLGQPEVSHRRFRSAVLRCAEPPLLDVDGELVRTTTTRFEIRCLPQVLRVAVRPDI
jgi:diacylglycerol kinase (ATP)